MSTPARAATDSEQDIDGGWRRWCRTLQAIGPRRLAKAPVTLNKNITASLAVTRRANSDFKKTLGRSAFIGYYTGLFAAWVAIQFALTWNHDSPAHRR